MEANLWLGGQKDRHLRFLSSWDSIFLYFLGWRRSETGDRFDMGNGSRVTIACLSQTIRSSQIAYCYTCGLFFTGATQGELPEGQEKVPWGITVSRNSLAWIFCTTPTNCTRYTVGCDDSAHRLYPTCTIYPVGRPLATHTTVNRHVNFPFSIINSQLLQIAKCNLPLQHLLRDQPQIGIIQLSFGLHAAQQHLIHRQHGVERLLRE